MILPLPKQTSWELVTESGLLIKYSPLIVFQALFAASYLLFSFNGDGRTLSVGETTPEEEVTTIL